MSKLPVFASKFRFSLYCFTTLLLFLPGCRPAHMAVPRSLQNSATVMEVSGRQKLSFDESFAIPPYQVTQVNRGWTRSTAWGIMMWNSSNRDQSYNFIVQNPGMTDFRVQCATDRSWQGLEFGDVFKGTLDIEYAVDANLLCEISQDKAAPVSLVMKYDDRGNMMLSGKLSDGKTQIAVRASNKLEGSPIALSTATGYFFSRSGKTIAAVDVINEGMIWLAADVSTQEQQLLTTASAALLLFQDLQE